MMRLSIIGFGLIGGSLALSARAAGVVTHVTAIDAPRVLSLAQSRGAADAFVDSADTDAASRALSNSTLTVIAAPVRAICERVEWALSHCPVVTDCGSTKRSIVAQARRSPQKRRFVPGHPMAGLPSGGFSSARADLFEKSAWLLCPDDVDADAFGTVEGFVAQLGARPIRVGAEEHDAAVARTSHLPQLLASALLILGEKHAALGAAGPAFARAVRTAGGSEAVWGDIFATNADEIALAIRALCRELEAVASELAADGGTQAANALLSRARALRGAAES